MRVFIEGGLGCAEWSRVWRGAFRSGAYGLVMNLIYLVDRAGVVGVELVPVEVEVLLRDGLDHRRAV